MGMDRLFLLHWRPWVKLPNAAIKPMKRVRAMVQQWANGQVFSKAYG